MRREIGGNLLKLFFFIGCGYGIVRISIWSFFQTQAFFAPFDTDGTKVISTALALSFQYGQNIALFMAAIGATKAIAYKNKISTISNNRVHVNILEEEIRKCEKSTYIYYILFAIFALVDAGTNLGQFFVQTIPTAEAKFAGIALTTFVVLGSLLSVVVVFVEELFMDTANAVLHALNDVLESLGKDRIPSLDLFVDPDKVIATRLGERNGKSGGGGGGNPQEQHVSARERVEKVHRQPTQGNPNRGGGYNPSEMGMTEEPTYHPVGMSSENKSNPKPRNKPLLIDDLQSFTDFNS